MFTVKLGTGKSFEATGVSESWFGERAEAPASARLTLERTGTDKTVDEYRALLSEEGALDTVTVENGEGETCLTAEGYTRLADISIRLLPDGSRAAAVNLEKPEE